MTIKPIVLAGFTTKLAKILTPEEAKKQENVLLRREALRRVNQEMTRQEKQLRQEMKRWHSDYPINAAAIGGSITGIPGAFAGSMVGIAGGKAVERALGPAIKRMAGGNEYAELAMSLPPGIAVALMERALPVAGGIITSVPGLIAGHEVGKRVAEWRTTDAHREAERKYQELWDKHRYDPELQKRVALAVERLQRK